MCRLECGGHDTYIVDLNHFSKEKLQEGFEQKVDAAILFDGLGWKGIESIYDIFDVSVVNILLDHPMNMWKIMEKPPRKYIQFCSDRNHVKYGKRFCHLEHSYMLPHIASTFYGENPAPLEVPIKDIEVLFSAGFTPCNEIYDRLIEQLPQEWIQTLALETIEILLTNVPYTVEEALEQCFHNRNIDWSDEYIWHCMSALKEVDMFVRMYYRQAVVQKIIPA